MHLSFSIEKSFFTKSIMIPRDNGSFARADMKFRQGESFLIFSRFVRFTFLLHRTKIFGHILKIFQIFNSRKVLWNFSAQTTRRVVWLTAFNSPHLRATKNTGCANGVPCIFWWTRGELNPCPKTS